MWSELLKKLSIAFFALFAFSFTYILINVVLKNHHANDKTFLIWGILIFIALIVALYALFNRFGKFIEARFNAILIAFLVIMAAIQLTMAFVLRFEPVFDLGAVYHGAVEWLNTGTFASHYEYYQYFPHNLGLLVIYRGLFGIVSAFGITDYFITASVFNCMLSIAMMCFAALVCKRLWGPKHGVTVLSLFFFSLPFWFIAPVFYTDAPAMFFPVFLFYLALRIKGCDDLKKRMINGILMGLAIGIGMLVKFIVVIPALALAIYMIIDKQKLKNIAVSAVYATLIAVFCFASVNLIVYNGNHLDMKLVERNGTPRLHWVMMGLSESGSYAPGDYDFTRSFAGDPDEQSRQITRVIFERIQNRGVDGMLNFLAYKSNRAFGDGTYGSSDFLDDSPQNRTFIHDFVLYEGVYYRAYANVTSGFFFGIIALAVIKSLHCLLSGIENRKIAFYLKLTALAMLILFVLNVLLDLNILKYMLLLFFLSMLGFLLWFKMPCIKSRDLSTLMPMLTVFGTMLFLLMWEVNSRYISLCIPMIIISAVPAVAHIYDAIRNRYGAIRKRLTKEKEA